MTETVKVQVTVYSGILLINVHVRRVAEAKDCCTECHVPEVAVAGGAIEPAVQNVVPVRDVEEGEVHNWNGDEGVRENRFCSLCKVLHRRH